MHYTSEQNQVIQHPSGHARIIAVAGSGKTQTLTAYVFARLAAGVSAKRMLILMYNKSAQLDFQRRLIEQSGIMQRSLPNVRTFHSLGYKLCERLVEQGHMPRFKRELLKDSEIELALWRILRSIADATLAEDILSRKKKWVEPLVAFIEQVKSTLESPSIVFERSGLPKSCELYIEAFDHFEDWRAQSQQLTFSDLLYEPAIRFQREPNVAKHFAAHMDEIIVDEYQDINPTQQYLLDVLHGERGQVIVVGDPDQTIYEFRGSRPSLLTHKFSEQYEAVTDYHLSNTFRFGDSVSLLANQVIAGNYHADHARTQCFSHSSTPNTEVEAIVSDDSATTALKSIKLWAENRPLTEIAVLNRLWSNSVRLELLLLAENIPYRLDNNTMVLERHELKPFRVLFQLASGEAANWSVTIRRAAWQALLTQPFLKVKKAVTDTLMKSLVSHSKNWGQALRNAIPESLSKYQAEQLLERARWIEKAERGKASAYELTVGWTQATDYYDALKDNAFSVAQVDDQIATVKAFARFLRQNNWLASEATAHLAELLQRKRNNKADGVLISSIHKAKGREWPLVIIPELNGSFFPYEPEHEHASPSSLASERRLLYVAITRAQEKLILLLPKESSEQPQSPFLPMDFVKGLPTLFQALEEQQQTISLPRLMHRPSVEHYINCLDSPLKVDWTLGHSNDTLIGQTISHPSLGIGQIVKESPTRLSIHFLAEKKIREFERSIVLPLIKF
ncbi:ATP-dependent helicase [Reinekea sp.]|uniref:ATP-dependent helicase n=1 Tax=Reinekea sp. TaxID=1970455 RepID=UPI003988C4D8